MTEQEEAAYVRGQRQAWVSLLRQCRRELGYDDAESRQSAWIVEREEAVAILRSACERHGDNAWPNDLHLADVIDKHLMRYVDAGE